MNAFFAPGDRVQCKAKSRRNGNVLLLFCNECAICKDKKYNICTSENEKKGWVLATFREPTTGALKRYRYERHELEHEDPLPSKPEEQVCDWSARDIRPLGIAQIDIPLIVSEDGEAENEYEDGGDLPKHNRAADGKAAMGMFFDHYLGISSKMERPV